MRRFTAAVSVLLALAFVLVVYASDAAQQADKSSQTNPIGKDGKPVLDTAALVKLEKELAAKYADFEKSLLTLCQRLANGDDKDKARAAQLQKVLDTSSGLGITAKFTQYVKLLSQQKQFGNTLEIDEAVRQSGALARDLKEILELLRNDSGAGSKREERIALEKWLKELDIVIRDEKLIRSQIPVNPDKNSVGNDQQQVTQNTVDLNKKMPGKGNEETPRDDKGEAKPAGKGDNPGKGKPAEPDKAGGDPKSGSKSSPGESKPGEAGKGQGAAKPGGGGKPSDQPPQQAGSKTDNDPSSSPKAGGSQNESDYAKAKKKIYEAIEHQRNVEENITKNKKDDAGKDADRAIEALESVRKAMEKLLRQLREEELERVLANLISRCQKMLAMQEEVLRGTLRVQSMIEATPSKKPDRDSIQSSLILSDDELKIVQEATQAIQILETEGSAVAFPEVFQQVREDMKHVQRRLKATDVGDVTMTIEQDIIDTLKEMIKALQKAQQDLKDKKSKPSKPGDPPPQQDQKLLDKIAELKMLRAMQIQVNARTELYGKRYQGEQALVPEIRLELHELAGRQERIMEVAQKMAKSDGQ